MAVNIQQELERLYSANKSREGSLSERLNAMDSYAGQVNPKVRSEMLDFSNRPEGYNPLQDVASAIDFSERSRDARSGASDELDATQKSSLDLLSQLDTLSQRSAAQTPEDKFTEALKLESAKAQIKAGTLRFNLETGKLEAVGDGSDDPQALAKTKVSSLKTAEKNPISDLAKAVTELNKIRQLFTEVYPNGDPDSLGSLFTGTTGPIAQFTGEYTNSPKQKQLRTEIGRLRDAIKKDTFGTAFTGTEKADATLMGKDRQEAENLRIVTSFYDSKVSELKRRLVNAGLSDGEADAYVMSVIPPKAATTKKEPEKKGASQYTIERIE